MSIRITAPRRRAAFAASSALATLFASGFAGAQTVAELPAVTVTQSRLFDRTEPSPETSATPRRVVRRAPATPAVRTPEPGATPSAGPTDIGIVGASNTVITADDIARAPQDSLAEIIGQTAGIQLRSLYGAVGGAGTTVDLRGFGAVASSNTLVLINGRRLNDLDLAGVDLTTVPRDSVARIEITRGNSGAVLYGDNAVGGVINIVTKTGAGGPPATARAEIGAGSYGLRTGALSSAFSSGPWSTSFYGNYLHSQGYRENNALNQRNGIGDIRYATPDFSAFLTLSGDDQRLGLPGTRTVDPSIGLDQLATNRRGASTPFDFANQQGANATGGFTKSLWNGGELIVDAGVRDKKQQATFFSSFGNSAVDSHLTTWSVTPRLRITNAVFGLPSTILTGIDFYDAEYNSKRGTALGGVPIHVYDLSQQSLAGYFQQTLTVLPSTDVSYGGRVQRVGLNARDVVDPLAPGNFGAVASDPLNTSETNSAWHVGLEHRFNPVLSVFGRAASAFRTPNVDERVSSGPSFDPVTFASIPGTFMLKIQTSNDYEAGVRVHAGALDVQTSVYLMNLTNEIQFDPVNFYNRNLDPTRRTGGEIQATLRASETLVFRGGAALTRAVFREGQYAGNDVPLVSRVTANAGVSWNIWQKYVVFDATARYWSRRFMDNDQSNTQRVIPANATVDLKLSGEVDRFFWSASVNNLFDVQYYDYAVASTFTPGRFAAYPLPGRTFLLKAGMVF